MEINSKPFDINTPKAANEKFKIDQKKNDYSEIKNKEFLIKPATPIKNANKVLISAR